MKAKLKFLILLPFFALLLLTSCQDEVVDITPINESEALVADSNLTALVSATSKRDGSIDNIIDKASCLSVELPVTVVVNNLEIIIDSEEDLQTIEAIFDEFEDDDDLLEIIFPIKIVTEEYEEIVIESASQLEEFAAGCSGENEADDDIECIDFKYPISFSVYDKNFQVIDVVSIGGDRQLHRFIRRVINAEVLASLNFPVTMVLADGTEKTVHNNLELEQTIEDAKDSCDEDDDNDYGDDDFTKEGLDNLLVTCPWVVHEFDRNEENLEDKYREYIIVFKENNVVKVRARNGDILTGTWTTRVADKGAMIKLEFDTLVDFTLEWLVYDLEAGRIKLYQVGGNRIILKKNCEIAFDVTKERILNYLQECMWRVERLRVEGIDNEKDYIGTPLKFFPDNVVKIRVNGEFVQGTYNVLAHNAGFVLQIQLDGRPNLHLEWLITFLEPGLIKLESLGNPNNRMVLERHCPNTDDDLSYIDGILTNGDWEVASYFIAEGEQEKADDFLMYTLNFFETGRVKVTDPNNGTFGGSWLSYRKEGLKLGLYFGDHAPFSALNHRWRIKEITETRIELKDFNANGEIERILVLEKKV